MTVLEDVIATSVRLRSRTREIYLAAVRRFLAFVEHDPARWNGPEVERWRDAMAAGEVKPQTVNLQFAGLRYASRRWSERESDPRFNFAVYAEKLPAAPKAKRVALTDVQARALVAACAGDRPADLRDRALILLGLKLGPRRAGICGAQLDDLVERTLTITLKGGERHDLHLDDETATAMDAWVAWLRSYGVVAGPILRALTVPNNDGDVVIRGRLSESGLYEIIKTRGEKAGLQLHPHLLRHTLVSQARALGIPDWQIAKLTGHRRLATPDEYTTDLSGKPIADLLPRLT